jgi:release factor glutamine methyltransferase
MTRAALLRAARERLTQGGVEGAALDARLLMFAALDLDPMEFVRAPDAAVDGAAATKFDALLARRLAREPVDRILGLREFHGLVFRLSPETLAPRPDTETLVDAALARIPRDAPARILDLGTGSGCILLAILHERPAASGVGVDRAFAAARMAAANAAALGLAGRAAFLAGDWATAIAQRFDLVVSNPPYIRSGGIAALSPEVRHDPRAALDGGADGLDAYRALAADLPRLVRPGGAALLEIGFDQAASVAEIAAAAGLAAGRPQRDLAGRDRMMTLEF